MNNLLDNLLLKAKSGDARAEDELMQYLSVRFVMIAKHNIGRGAAEDIAQEACLTIVKKYKTETYTKSFQAWAYGVLKMKIKAHIADLIRERDRIVSELESYKCQPIQPPEIDPDLRRRLAKCFKQIMRQNIPYARALNLAYHGYKAPEIAVKLKVNVNNLYVILSRGRSMLDLCLKRGTI
jgi:RNA polymerase sigma factor (sigma-70 family)